MSLSALMPAKSFGDLDMIQMRFFALIAAIGLYAVLGVPTPDNPGVTEVLIGVLLVLAVSPAGALRAITFDRDAPLWQSAGQILLLYGLTFSLLNGVASGQPPSLILRDLLPFLFMALPVLVGDVFGSDRVYSRAFVIMVAIVGFVFAFRALFELWADPLGLFFGEEKQELTYLANAPTLLFGVLYVLGCSGLNLLRRFNLGALIVFILALALCLIPLVAMGATLQRASIGYAVFAILVLFMVGFARAPYRSFAMLVMICALSVPFWGDVQIMIDSLSQKTLLFGVNMRGAEWATVWSEISAQPLRVLFGLGWGGTFESPAVAGVRVNFTHGLLSSMVLKTGLVGLALTVLYIGALLHELFKNTQTNLILFLAIAGPVLIDVLLYASFKSLDFGLLLLVIPSLKAFDQGDSLHSEQG